MRWPFVLLILFPSYIGAAQEQPQAAQDWAWEQIRADGVADFNARCGTLDPRKDAGWNDECRMISARFLQDILIDPKRQSELSHHRIVLLGARINGAMDLTATDVNAQVWVKDSKFEGDLNLNSSHWSRGLSLARSMVNGAVTLLDTKIDGRLELDGASFAKVLNAGNLTVGNNLEMTDSAFGGDVILRNAKIGGQVDMSHASFAGTLNANGLSIEHNLLMQSGATFTGDVNLIGSKVDGQIDMTKASFAKMLKADNLIVGRALFLSEGTFGGDVILNGAKVSGLVDMIGGSFAGILDAGDLTVGTSLLMVGAKFGDGVLMSGVKTGSLRFDGGATSFLDLSNAEVAEELNLAQLGWHYCVTRNPNPLERREFKSESDELRADPSHWPLATLDWQRAICEPPRHAFVTPSLILRNAHAGALQDSDDAWPPTLDLEGFRYDRLGGTYFRGWHNEMLQRSPARWVDWLARSEFSTQPYIQLASVLSAAGHRNAAETVQYAGRERERQEDWSRGDWLQWGWLTVLSGAVGYGIGLETFRVLLPVFVLTLVGAVVLSFSPKARRRGRWWLFFASLHRLLPGVELAKEFTDFFDNPPPEHVDEPRNLNTFQVTFFACLGIIGAILGGVLVAAVSGLLPKV